MNDTSRIIHQLLDRDNWEVIDEIDTFLYVFDKMPDQMRLIVDFKMTGNTNQEIAKLLGISDGHVRKQVSRAKDRIIKALH